MIGIKINRNQKQEGKIVTYTYAYLRLFQPYPLFHPQLTAELHPPLPRRHVRLRRTRVRATLHPLSLTRSHRVSLTLHGLSLHRMHLLFPEIAIL